MTGRDLPVAAAITQPTPFRKILVANRGEIACRVIRTARAMGYLTVAVYSSADASERHVREADESVCIGGAQPSSSYLNIASIIRAATLTGADAVHPGYGFLAENEDFAAACKSAGLVFIGPSSEAIALMGNKAGAKRIMQAAGVPCVPGFQGESRDDDALVAAAQAIGYPIMIKATAGGGGRGMRQVHSPREFVSMLRSARSEAQAAFGSGDVILERAIVNPRHVEIQILVDRYGNAIHLGERDCSVQRRHQKIIEEAPSPAVDAELRRRMGEISVTAARAIRYEGAGTLEFLLDQQGNFYFMEMNTRLQVEHPVTELTTGLDLVEQQIRIAAGEVLRLRQQDIRFDGHAIEVRMCAEDPANDFLPQSGLMQRWSVPPDVRVEEALYPGASISPYYDSMLAKIISHGRTREEARRKLASAMQGVVALGVRTNQEFLLKCLSHPEFVAGNASTSFVGRHKEDLLARTAGERRAAAAVGAALMVRTGDSARGPRAEVRLLRTSQILFDMDAQPVLATVAPRTDCAYEVTIDGEAMEVEVRLMDNNQAVVACDGVRDTVTWFADGAVLWIQRKERAIMLVDRTRAAAIHTRSGEGDGKLRALMNGRVVAVMVGVGDEVKPGQALVTIEAMKMEHVHSASVSGRVVAVHAHPGEQVSVRAVLAEVV